MTLLLLLAALSAPERCDHRVLVLNSFPHRAVGWKTEPKCGLSKLRVRITTNRTGESSVQCSTSNKPDEVYTWIQRHVGMHAAWDMIWPVAGAVECQYTYYPEAARNKQEAVTSPRSWIYVGWTD